jgi:hypothetical protein
MANSGERVTDVASTEDKLIVFPADGRSISVPLPWYPRLLHSTPRERDNWGLLALALESTGQILMRTSVWRAFFVEHHLRR